MTDAHCHELGDAGRHFVCDPCDRASIASRAQPGTVVFFRGFHPWEAERFDAAALRRALEDDPGAGVGEIGLDRLRSRDICPAMREAFAAQLEIAAEFARPVALHGAKCWGEVVKAVRPYAGRIPAFLFHGFSRSEGLLGEIAALNGFVSVGPALLNTHAANYRRLAASLPGDMLLVESDRTPENTDAPSVVDVFAELARLRNVEPVVLAATLERNARRFVSSLPTQAGENMV